MARTVKSSMSSSTTTLIVVVALSALLFVSSSSFVFGEVDPHSNDIYQSRVWLEGFGVDSNARSSIQIPEQTTYPIVDAKKKVKTGIALSGGGFRAASASVGVLRALCELGLVDKADYMTSVSGSSWVTVPFTFYKQGVDNDTQLLGRAVDPRTLTLQYLSSTPEMQLGHQAAESYLDIASGLKDMLEYNTVHNIEGYPYSLLEIWNDALGEIWLDRYGLHDRTYTQHFSWDNYTVSDIKARNPTLKGHIFNTVRKGEKNKRPYLLTNSILMGSEDTIGSKGNEWYPMVWSPLYVGSAALRNETVYSLLHPISGLQYQFGGGFIEPFVFNGGAPLSPLRHGTNIFRKPLRSFTLTDMSAASSDIPTRTYDHFAMPPNTIPNAQPLRYADGGMLENTGVITLLLRGVTRIMCFLHTSARLTDPSDGVLKDGELGRLFGFQATGVLASPADHLQVFDQSQYASIEQEMYKQAQQGRMPFVKSTLRVVDNKWYGLKGGYDVQIVWNFLARDEEFETMLPRETAAMIEAGNKPGAGSFTPYGNFPNYSLVRNLTVPEASLLTELLSYQVLKNQVVLGQLFSA